MDERIVGTEKMTKRPKYVWKRRGKEVGKDKEREG